MIKKLPVPPATVDVAAETCASGISIAERARILREAIPVMQVAELDYRNRGGVGEFHLIAGSHSVTDELDQPLMDTIYKNHFVPKTSPTRPIYDQILHAQSSNGRCPSCGQRDVTAVDHYLPKSKYPKLALTPINLVPICDVCNKKKLAKSPATAEEQFIHPYFDDLGQERWLHADIQPTSPPTVTYYIKPPTSWRAIQALTERVEKQFALLELGDLYAAQVASELPEIAGALIEIGDAAGDEDVRAHLQLLFRSFRASDPNSWKTALYEAMANSDWFCSEGYRMIR